MIAPPLEKNYGCCCGATKSTASPLIIGGCCEQLFFGGTIMARTIDALKNRINLLQERDPIGNQRIVNKLKRRVRAMEKEAGQK